MAPKHREVIEDEISRIDDRMRENGASIVVGNYVQSKQPFVHIIVLLFQQFEEIVRRMHKTIQDKWKKSEDILRLNLPMTELMGVVIGDKRSRNKALERHGSALLDDFRALGIYDYIVLMSNLSQTCNDVRACIDASGNSTWEVLYRNYLQVAVQSLPFQAAHQQTKKEKGRCQVCICRDDVKICVPKSCKSLHDWRRTVTRACALLTGHKDLADAEEQLKEINARAKVIQRREAVASARLLKYGTEINKEIFRERDYLSQQRQLVSQQVFTKKTETKKYNVLSCTLCGKSFSDMVSFHGHDCMLIGSHNLISSKGDALANMSQRQLTCYRALLVQIRESTRCTKCSSFQQNTNKHQSMIKMLPMAWWHGIMHSKKTRLIPLKECTTFLDVWKLYCNATRVGSTSTLPKLCMRGCKDRAPGEFVNVIEKQRELVVLELTGAIEDIWTVLVATDVIAGNGGEWAMPNIVVFIALVIVCMVDVDVHCLSEALRSFRCLCTQSECTCSANGPCADFETEITRAITTLCSALAMLEAGTYKPGHAGDGDTNLYRYLVGGRQSMCNFHDTVQQTRLLKRLHQGVLTLLGCLHTGAYDSTIVDMQGVVDAIKRMTILSTRASLSRLHQCARNMARNCTVPLPGSSLKTILSFKVYSMMLGITTKGIISIVDVESLKKLTALINFPSTAPFDPAPTLYQVILDSIADIKRKFVLTLEGYHEHVRQGGSNWMAVLRECLTQQMCWRLPPQSPLSTNARCYYDMKTHAFFVVLGETDTRVEASIAAYKK